MKLYGKILALGMAAAMSLSLTACVAHPEASTVDALIELSNKNSAEISSYDYEGKLYLDVVEDAEATLIDAEFKGSIAAGDKKMGMEMTSKDEKGVKTEMKYFMAPTEDGKNVKYVFENNKWIAAEINTDDAMTQMNVLAANDELQEDAKGSFAIAEKDVVGGLNATVIEGSIDGAAMISSINMAIEMMNFDKVSAEDLAKAIADVSEENPVKVRIWVLDSNLVPVKYQYDFTELMNAAMKSVATSKVVAEEGSEVAQKAAADKVQVDECTMEMSLKNFNRGKAIVVPEEALKAEVILLKADVAEPAAPAETAEAADAEKEAADAEAADKDADADAEGTDADAEGTDAEGTDADAEGTDAEGADADAEGTDAEGTDADKTADAEGEAA